MFFFLSIDASRLICLLFWMNFSPYLELFISPARDAFNILMKMSKLQFHDIQFSAVVSVKLWPKWNENIQYKWMMWKLCNFETCDVFLHFVLLIMILNLESINEIDFFLFIFSVKWINRLRTFGFLKILASHSFPCSICNTNQISWEHNFLLLPILYLFLQFTLPSLSSKVFLEL